MQPFNELNTTLFEHQGGASKGCAEAHPPAVLATTPPLATRLFDVGGWNGQPRLFYGAKVAC